MRLVTFNVMAQRFYKGKLEWSDRIKRIVEILKNSRCDIICLQEVEIADFKKDYQELLDEYSFYGHQIDKRRTSPIGNFILWKKHLTVNNYRATSCSVTVDVDGTSLCNVHFSRQAETRVNQVVSVLKGAPDILVGDFNNGELTLEGYQKFADIYTCYSKNTDRFGKFDNVYCKRKNITVTGEKIRNNVPNLFNPSDHIPLYIEIEYK